MKWVETSREGWKGFNQRKYIGDFVKCFGRALPFEKEEQVKLGWGDCGEKVNTGAGKPGQRREWRSGDANCGTNANCASKNLSKGGVEKSAKSANIVSVGSQYWPILSINMSSVYTAYILHHMHCSTVHWVHLHTEGMSHTCLSQCCVLQACCMCNTDNTEALSSLLENCVRRKSNTAEISLCCQWWRLREFKECLACHYQWGFNELFVGCAGMSAVYQSMLSQSVYITYIYVHATNNTYIPKGACSSCASQCISFHAKYARYHRHIHSNVILGVVHCIVYSTILMW